MFDVRLIPENCKAVEDFRAGKITEPEMWRIISRNIKIEVGCDAEKQQYPRKGDFAINHAENGRTGVVLWRSSEEVGVRYFDNKEYDSLPLESFDSYDSRGGRTKWELY